MRVMFPDWDGEVPETDLPTLTMEEVRDLLYSHPEGLFALRGDDAPAWARGVHAGMAWVVSYEVDEESAAYDTDFPHSGPFRLVRYVGRIPTHADEHGWHEIEDITRETIPWCEV